MMMVKEMMGGGLISEGLEGVSEAEGLSWYLVCRRPYVTPAKNIARQL